MKLILKIDRSELSKQPLKEAKKVKKGSPPSNRETEKLSALIKGFKK